MTRSLRRGGAEHDDWRIELLLQEIGAPMSAETPFGALSGGWRRLVLIAGLAALEEQDILLLDEPTNHLDLANIATLERWLTQTFHQPMLIVSHDRAFLDRVTERTLFLRTDGVHAFKANFSRAREELLRQDAAKAAHRRLELKEVRRLEAAAARYKVWAVKNPALNKRKNAIETRVARLEARRTPLYRAVHRRLELSDSEIEAKAALKIDGLTVKSPDGTRILIRIDRFALGSGDKAALLGANGAGKSTFLGVLARAYEGRQEHYDGQAPVRFNPAARLAYFDQAMADLPLSHSPLQHLAAAPGMTREAAVRHLVQAGFAVRRLQEALLDFSHGERTRLCFLRMKLSAPNIYLLDEPTNHLDIEGQEALEAELDQVETACLFVSHDRHFVRSAANRFIEIRNGRLVEVEDPDAFFAAQEDDAP
jgi:ATPase subunit of ABC transporter with duplicated ATPase domains